MSKSSDTQAFIRREQGFDVHILQNVFLELSVVPELGAKVISLVNRETGRDWMWHPPGPLKLFRNQPGDNFGTSTITGWDECLPTIAPCSHKGRALPDHGEVWSEPWQCDSEAWLRGVLKTSLRLSVSPFLFERSIELSDNVIQLDYQLTNLGGEPEEFLWAMHPLIPVCEGDELELTGETRDCLAGESWLGNLDLTDREPACVKVFAGPLREGRAGVANARTGDRLTFEWDTTLNNMLGLWLTRGGWNDYHHLAIEPTNGAPDSLSEAAGPKKRCGSIAPNARISWRVEIRVDPFQKIHL
jgi:hypothetical protein